MKVRLALATLAIVTLWTQSVAADSQVFDKPLFLMVFDKTCHAWCEKTRPMVKELKDQYSDKIDFAEIDITQEMLAESKKEAKRLGVSQLLPDFGDQVPCCAVCGKKRSDILGELAGPKSKAKYEELVQLALSKK